MKRACLMAAVAGLVSMVSVNATIDGYITTSGYGPHNSGSGDGENGGAFVFQATPPFGSLILGADNKFQTFCMEKSETFNPSNTKYGVDISDAATGGGGGALGGKDPISVGTSWLYQQFRLNPSAIGYDGSNAEAGALQQTFWLLEQEVGSVTDNQFLNLVTTKFGSLTAARADAAVNNPYGVVVLNLKNLKADGSEGSDAQSHLGLVPEPTTVLAGLMLLLPFGVSALRIVRRNKA